MNKPNFNPTLAGWYFFTQGNGTSRIFAAYSVAEARVRLPDGAELHGPIETEWRAREMAANAMTFSKGRKELFIPPNDPPPGLTLAEIREAMADLRTAVDDADGIAQDMLRPPGERELGRVLHEYNYRDARWRILFRMREVMEYLTAEPSDPADPAGSGGAGAAER